MAKRQPTTTTPHPSTEPAKAGARVVAYLRTSNHETPTDASSLEAQRRKVEAWAEVHGAELVAVLVDEGCSAKALDRPGLQEALGMLRDGSAAALLVCKLDRLTRSQRDLLTVAQELANKSARLVSIAEDLDTSTAPGRMVLNMLGAMAEHRPDPQPLAILQAAPWLVESVAECAAEEYPTTAAASNSLRAAAVVTVLARRLDEYLPAQPEGELLANVEELLEDWADTANGGRADVARAFSLMAESLDS